MMPWNSPDHEDELDSFVKDALSERVPAPVEHRMRRELNLFRERLQTRGSTGLRPRSFTRVAFRAGLAMVTVAVVLYAAGYFSGGSVEPSWAQVVERFGSVPFFNATIYARADSSAEPIQLELWMGHGGRMRLRAGNEVFFGREGRMTEGVVFAPDTGQPTNMQHVRRTVEGLVAAIGDAETFSLETLIQALPGGIRLSPPLANENASISRDLIVFDVVRDDSPDWTRIWALRESRLPVRLMFWGPNSGESVDVFLSYADRQPAEFFDPAAFKQALEEGPNGPGCGAYCLLKDPGGRPITQQDVEKLPTAGAEQDSAPQKPAA